MSSSHKPFVWISCAAGLILAFTGSPAVAQEKKQDNVSGLALEEVIVTARRRDETLLDVPLTITVLTTADIDEKDIGELRDVVDYTPGFYFGGPSGGNNDRSSRRLIMRGMQVNTDVQTRQGSMVFIDGAPVLGAEIGGTENAERIETIKGPQSAYFGRSTFGGAINIITRNPKLDRWHAKVNFGTGSYNTNSYGLQVEGPLVADKVGIRVSASSNANDGHYVNAAGGERLGDRETKDASMTLYAKPNEQSSAKLRMHYWIDDDGPSASLGYGIRNGVDVFNCFLGGTARAINGINNWVCGIPRFPTPSEINVDVSMFDAFRRLLAGDPTVCPGCALLNGNDFLTHYGLRREAYEASLNLEYRFGNGLTLSSITATHSNLSARIDDFDRKATAALVIPGRTAVSLNTVGVAHRDLSDFSQEIRLTSSAEQKFPWLIGASYSKIEQLSLGANRNSQGIWSSGSAGTALNKVETTGFFGGVSYRFGEKFTVSLEARGQKDKVTDGSEAYTGLNGAVVPAGATFTGTFQSFTPRVLLDYKPTNNITVYGIFAQGTRPGEFNSQLVSPLINATVLACIATKIYAGIEIPEEKLDNFEAGVKGRFLDGRMTLTAATYFSKWRDQHNRGETTCPDINGVIRGFQSTGLGGSSDLKGVELEMKIAATEHLTLESTFAYNDTDILVRDCADCLVILGNRELAGLHKQFSRYPKASGTLSGSYQHPLKENSTWFARIDYIHTGNQYATEANLAETGIAKKVNLRIGVKTANGLRLEAYGTNIFNDKTFQGYQRFDDGAFPGFHMLTAGLPDKAVFGMRASYDFDFSADR